MRVLLLLSIAFLVSCDSFEVFPPVSVGGVSLETDGPDDGVLGTVGLVLRNESAAAIEAEACAFVEERVGDRWTAERVGVPTCDLETVVLEAGGFRLEPFDTRALRNGTYRFVQETSVGAVASSSLRVDR